jgi:Transposase IS116/IS110/IS902 family
MGYRWFESISLQRGVLCEPGSGATRLPSTAVSAGRTFAGYGGGDTLQTIIDQLNGTMARIREIEGRLATWHRQSRVSRLLATVPAIGIMGARAIAATVADPSLFRSGREFAAWLAITITADLSEAANQNAIAPNLSFAPGPRSS